jgi:hypothetical protein
MAQSQPWNPWQEAWSRALHYGSSTGISVLWIGLCGLLFAFLFTIGIEWLCRGRNLKALIDSLRSWTSWAGGVLAFIVVWTCLYIYAFVVTVHQDHDTLVQQRNAASAERDAWKKKAETSAPTSIPQTELPKITWTQEPLQPGNAGYPAGQSDKPGVLATITTWDDFDSPAFQAKCSAPCSILTAMAIDSSTGPKPLPQPSLDIVRIQFTIPGRLAVGKQVTLDIRSRDSRPVSLIWVRPLVHKNP